LFLLAARLLGADPATGERGIVATGHPLATQAALKALQNGGNAIDAAVAAALTLGVVEGYNSGIGGGCFLLIRLASGECVAIDGRETAPAAAHRDMFVRHGKAETRLSQVGALASATPGALAAYDLATRNYGKLSLETELLAAAAIAEDGFPIDRTFAARSRASATELSSFESSRALFLKPNGDPLSEGDTLKQPDLARSYRAIAEHGIAWFYDGPFSQTTAAWMEKNGGILSTQDFKDYRVRLREPLRGTYRGYELVGFPPPSSGGVHVFEILNVLENFELRELQQNSPDMIHLVAEAMKLAFADRAYWLGDPDFARIPRGLVSKQYAAKLTAEIHMDAATRVEGHRVPENAGNDVFEKHTTHFSIADAQGNWVACTATINTAFGSKVVVPGTGVLLNNEMDDFSIEPGVPNAFNLIGAEANAVAPGKRPLSSMSPTIVLNEGVPLLAIGAAGGPTIISQTLLAIINFVDYDMPVDALLSTPRFHHQWQPDELKIERLIGSAVAAELRMRGHTVSEVETFGACQAVGLDRNSQKFIGLPDPRGLGAAGGW